MTAEDFRNYIHIVRGGRFLNERKEMSRFIETSNRQHRYIWFCNVRTLTTDEVIELKALLNQAESLAKIIGLTEAKLKISAC